MHAPTLAVIDGITEAMTLHGLNPLDNTDAATFGRMLPRRITEAGAAVVSLDHVVKDREGRGRYALGAVHKLNGLDGAAYLLENRTPVRRRDHRPVHRQDRQGPTRPATAATRSRRRGGMHWYGDLVLDSHAEDFAEVTIEPPHERAEDFRPTVLMARIAAALTEHGPLAQRRILAAAQGQPGQPYPAPSTTSSSTATSPTGRPTSWSSRTHRVVILDDHHPVPNPFPTVPQERLVDPFPRSPPLRGNGNGNGHRPTAPDPGAPKRSHRSGSVPATGRRHDCFVRRGQPGAGCLPWSWPRRRI